MDTLHRREFVRSSTAAAASGLFFSAGAASALRAAGGIPASERIQVGLVGVGGRAGTLLQLFADQPDVDLVAVADLDARRIPRALQQAERRSGRAPEVMRDYRDLIDDKRLDALVVGTPDHWHAIPTILACLAEKDVYVEKPDGHNMLEGQRMVQAQRKTNRIVQLGTQARSSPHFQAALEFIRTGQLGRVLVAKAWESARQGNIGRPADSVPPDGVDYDMWLGPAPQRPFNERRFHGSWRWFFDYGTGDLGNDGVHRLDVARWALATAVHVETGQAMSPLPRYISAQGGKWYFDDLQEWPDTLQANYEFTVEGQAGRTLTYEMKLWTPYKYMGESEGVVLFGDQAYLVIGNRSWHAHQPDGKVIAEGRGDNTGTEHVRNFLDCIKSRQPSNADLATVGNPTSLLCHAGNVAWRTKKTLQLDPQTELFDNDDANQLRSRPEYRKPWTLPDVV